MTGSTFLIFFAVLPFLWCNQVLVIAGDESTLLTSHQFKERHRFESLLAGGRSIAFPFSTGLILSVLESEKENWNISLKGMEQILHIQTADLAFTYANATEIMTQDEAVNQTIILYALRGNWKNESILVSNSSSALEKLKIKVERVTWNEETANTTWRLMDKNLKESTNHLLDGKFIPQVSNALGNPFRISTQAIMISTFHGKWRWRNEWMESERVKVWNGQQHSGNLSNTFLFTKGDFMLSESEDFTAIKIPLEGESKSLVFTLPKVDLKEFLRGKLKQKTRGENNEDLVPFPTRWENKTIQIHLPRVSLTSYDQYGKEMEKLGMNETFCTTSHDRRGAIPYFLRPIVQSNAINFTQDFVELASATGTAVEKFYFGLDISGIGIPKRADGFINSNEDALEKATTDASSIEETTSAPSSVGNGGSYIFDRPFLWYLDDIKLGPIFYGIVEKLTDDLESPSSPEDNSELLQLAERYFMWSCRSFKQSGEVREEQIAFPTTTTET